MGMMIYTHTKKSKAKKPTAKQRELDASWALIVKKYETKKSLPKSVIAYSPPKPFVRETVKHPSLQTYGGNCTKPIHGKVYTGDKMIGIGTLHKSNAVPIFTDEDAKDQASMRR
jgi:hypothetical protein